jgi:hypothetical protein
MLNNKLCLTSVVEFLRRGRVDHGTEGGKIVVVVDSSKRKVEAIFVQSTIYAHESRDVATCDIPGAFLQADNPDFVLMRLDDTR